MNEKVGGGYLFMFVNDVAIIQKPSRYHVDNPVLYGIHYKHTHI